MSNALLFLGIMIFLLIQSRRAGVKKYNRDGNIISKRPLNIIVLMFILISIIFSVVMSVLYVSKGLGEFSELFDVDFIALIIVLGLSTVITIYDYIMIGDGIFENGIINQGMFIKWDLIHKYGIDTRDGEQYIRFNIRKRVLILSVEANESEIQSFLTRKINKG